MTEDVLITKERFPIEPLDEEAGENIRMAFSKIEGIENLTVGNSVLEVSFFPQIVSPQLIKSIITEAGLTLIETRKSKGIFGRFVDRLAESNKKNFGSQKLDCCDLNKNKNSGSSD